MIRIKNIDTETKLHEVFVFLSREFYLDSKEYNEMYYPMGDRFFEMKDQYLKDPQLLYYIENEKEEIIGALTSKNMNLKKQTISLGMIAVKRQYRINGLGAMLLERFEKDCTSKGIRRISLGSRKRACGFYLANGYSPQLFVQVYDFEKISDIKRKNIFDLEILEQFESEVMGYIIFEISDFKLGYIDYFEKEIPTANVQYLFYKELDKNI